MGDHAGNALAYNRGVLAFHQKYFDQAEKHFNIVLNDYEDLFYGCDARLWLLKVYYDTGNAIGLESMMESFRMFLQRHKTLGKPHKDRYLTFINYLRRIMNIPPKDTHRMRVLWEELNGAKGQKDVWLMDTVRVLW